MLPRDQNMITAHLHYPEDWSYQHCRGVPFLAADQPHSLDVILSAYNLTSQRLRMQQAAAKLKTKDRLILETYRLLLMEAVLRALVPPANAAKNAELPKPKSKLKYWRTFFVEKIKLGLLLFAGIVGTFEMAMWTYLGSAAAVSALLPPLLTVLVIPASVVLTVIGVLLFIGFDFDKVRQMLGISVDSNKLKTLVIQTEQVECAKKINQALDNRHIHAKLQQQGTLDIFYEAASVFNMDVQLFKDGFKEYQESKVKKFFRGFVSGFGALLMLIEAYFGTQMLLGMALTAISPPIGIAITVTVMLATLILYFSMRGSGLDTFLNSLKDASHKMAEALNTFEQPLHQVRLDAPQVAKKKEPEAPKVTPLAPLAYCLRLFQRENKKRQGADPQPRVVSHPKL